MKIKVTTGDCLAVMAAMDDESVDAVVTDPPYALGFMGQAWDRIGDTGRGARARVERAREVTPVGQGHSTSSGPFLASGVDSLRSAGHPFQLWCEAWAREAYRVLKPGGHLLAFGGTRTSHRLVCGVEDAGFEIRDSIMWIYGSGMPKSKNLKGDHEGWGTGLKPGHEPIVAARKALVGTVEQNVREYGTGALNIAATRIEYLSEQDRSSAIPQGRATAKVGALAGGVQNARERSEFAADNTKGRWPANVVLDEDAAVELDTQTGTLTSGFMAAGTQREGIGYRGRPGNRVRNDTYGDAGGASRFFYCAKASRSERNAGLDGMPKSKRSDDGYGSIQRPILDRAAPRENWEPHATANDHPTVKPIELMRWVVRLVTPPGGLVLDPFAGSGSTGCAAALEGFDFIGIEQDEHYADIARRRIAHWAGPLLMEVVA